MNQQLQKFCDKYQATVRPSQQRHRRTYPLRMSQYLNQHVDVMNEPVMDYHEVGMVDITMPEDRFRALMEHDQWLNQGQMRHTYAGAAAVAIVQEREQECLIRQSHEAVRLAWEQYQLLLNLAR